jgi:hypothetical protein
MAALIVYNKVEGNCLGHIDGNSLEKTIWAQE